MRPAALRRQSASAEAAAAAAARTVLLQQVPAQKALIEQAFEASTKAIPDGAAKKDGIAIGEKCGAAVIADRASDGTSVPDTYRPVTSPGRLDPDDAADVRRNMLAPSPGS